MGYDFVIEYKQGKYIQVTNGFSRKREETIIYIMTLPSPNWWDSIMELHETNNEIKNLKEKAEKGELVEQWSVKIGVLF